MAAADLGSPLRAAFRLAAYGAFTLPLMPLQALAVALDLPLQTGLPLWYHRQCCRILGVHVERRGQRSSVRPTLYVCNHISYLDIMVLGSLIRGSFVAKSEVRGWPLFGWLAKLQRSVFVERRGRQIATQRDAIARRLERGDNLILFAEGTSGDGNRVLPFKSALFSVAEPRPGAPPLVVQPVSIGYTRLDGTPMGRNFRPFFAWYGDMDLASHIWQAMGFGWVTAVVEFHPTLTWAAAGTRRALSEHCQAQIAGGLSSALAGREAAPVEQVLAQQPRVEHQEEAPR